MKLTVYFDGRIWIGIFERRENGQYYVYRHLFYTEPKENEILEFVMRRLVSIDFGMGDRDDEKIEIIAFKRRLKLIRENMSSDKHLKKSHDILKKEMEMRKSIHKTELKEKKEFLTKERFIKKIEKKKKKAAGH